jgi:hypothetical protein
MDREPRPVGEDLAQIADELLEHTRALRRQHEELRDALDGAASAPAPASRSSNGGGMADDERGLPDSLHAMALQMALAGETREAVKQQFQTLHVEDSDGGEIVDEVFDRIETRRAEGKRRLFTRRHQ